MMKLLPDWCHQGPDHVRTASQHYCYLYALFVFNKINSEKGKGKRREEKEKEREEYTNRRERRID